VGYACARATLARCASPSRLDLVRNDRGDCLARLLDQRRRPLQAFQECRDIAPPAEAMEALLGLRKGIGEPTVGLVGLRTPAADPAGAGPAVAHGVLDAVGAQQVDVEGRRRIEKVKRDERVPGFVQALHGLVAVAGEKPPDFRQDLAARLFPLGRAQPVEQQRQFAVVPMQRQERMFRSLCTRQRWMTISGKCCFSEWVRALAPSTTASGLPPKDSPR